MPRPLAECDPNRTATTAEVPASSPVPADGVHVSILDYRIQCLDLRQVAVVGASLSPIIHMPRVVVMLESLGKRFRRIHNGQPASRSHGLASYRTLTAAPF